MRLYQKIWVPNDLDQLATKYMLIGPDHHNPIGGLDQKENVIVLTTTELADIMQQAVEDVRVTLLRESALELIKAKLANK